MMKLVLGVLKVMLYNWYIFRWAKVPRQNNVNSKTFRGNCNNTIQVIGLQEFQLASLFVNHCFYTVYVQSTIIQCYNGRLTNCVFWTQGQGGWRVLQLDALKISKKSIFDKTNFRDLAVFLSLSKPQWPINKLNQLQEEDAPESEIICVSKPKINRPQISFNFLKKKIDFGGWTLWRGGGGSEKSVQRTLWVKKSICESSLNNK